MLGSSRVFHHYIDVASPDGLGLHGFTCTQRTGWPPSLTIKTSREIGFAEGWWTEMGEEAPFFDGQLSSINNEDRSLTSDLDPSEASSHQPVGCIHLFPRDIYEQLDIAHRYFKRASSLRKNDWKRTSSSRFSTRTTPDTILIPNKINEKFPYSSNDMLSSSAPQNSFLSYTLGMMGSKKRKVNSHSLSSSPSKTPLNSSEEFTTIHSKAYKEGVTYNKIEVQFRQDNISVSDLGDMISLWGYNVENIVYMDKFLRKIVSLENNETYLQENIATNSTFVSITTGKCTPLSAWIIESFEDIINVKYLFCKDEIFNGSYLASSWNDRDSITKTLSDSIEALKDGTFMSYIFDVHSDVLIKDEKRLLYIPSEQLWEHISEMKNTDTVIKKHIIQFSIPKENLFYLDDEPNILIKMKIPNIDSKRKFSFVYSCKMESDIDIPCVVLNRNNFSFLELYQIKLENNIIYPENFNILLELSYIVDDTSLELRKIEEDISDETIINQQLASHSSLINIKKEFTSINNEHMLLNSIWKGWSLSHDSYDKYDENKEKLIHDFNIFLSDSSNFKDLLYTKYSNQSYLKAYHRQIDGHISGLIKVVAKFVPTEKAKSVVDILPFILETDYRKLWDNGLSSEVVIIEHGTGFPENRDVNFELSNDGKKFNSINQLLHIKMKPVWPTSQRDAVVFRTILISHDLKHARVIVQSLKDEDCPGIEDGVVRACLDLNIWDIFFTNDEIVIKYAIQFDPKGWIPSTLLATATQSLAKDVEFLWKAASKWGSLGMVDIFYRLNKAVVVNDFQKLTSRINSNGKIATYLPANCGISLKSSNNIAFCVVDVLNSAEFYTEEKHPIATQVSGRLLLIKPHESNDNEAWTLDVTTSYNHKKHYFNNVEIVYNLGNTLDDEFFIDSFSECFSRHDRAYRILFILRNSIIKNENIIEEPKQDKDSSSIINGADDLNSFDMENNGLFSSIFGPSKRTKQKTWHPSVTTNLNNQGEELLLHTPMVDKDSLLRTPVADTDLIHDANINSGNILESSNSSPVKSSSSFISLIKRNPLGSPLKRKVFSQSASINGSTQSLIYDSNNNPFTSSRSASANKFSTTTGFSNVVNTWKDKLLGSVEDKNIINEKQKGVMMSNMGDNNINGTSGKSSDLVSKLIERRSISTQTEDISILELSNNWKLSERKWDKFLLEVENYNKPKLILFSIPAIWTFIKFIGLIIHYILWDYSLGLVIGIFSRLYIEPRISFMSQKLEQETEEDYNYYAYETGDLVLEDKENNNSINKKGKELILVNILGIQIKLLTNLITPNKYINEIENNQGNRNHLDQDESSNDKNDVDGTTPLIENMVKEKIIILKSDDKVIKHKIPYKIGDTRGIYLPTTSNKNKVPGSFIDKNIKSTTIVFGPHILFILAILSYMLGVYLHYKFIM